MRPYVGDVRVLRGRADEKSFTVSPKQAASSGECDMAVRVRSAGFQKGGALFTLDTIGRPAVAGREPRCRTVQPTVQLLVAGLTPASSDLATRVDAVLSDPRRPTSSSKGVTFDRPAAETAQEIASPDVPRARAGGGAREEGEGLAQGAASREPLVHDPSGRLRQDSEVEFDAVVGTDGCVHDPQLKTALSEAHQDVVLGRAVALALRAGAHGRRPGGRARQLPADLRLLLIATVARPAARPGNRIRTPPVRAAPDHLNLIARRT